MAQPFDIQPKAFQSSLRQPESEPTRSWQIQSDDFVSVMLGSAAEVGIDVASFGIFQPDIVPDYMERNSPIAYFIGSTAGMISGMYPSFGAAGLALKGVRSVFNTFKFSSRVLKVAESMSAVEQIAQRAKPAHAFATNIGHTAAVFALNDSAREITRQVKENDPSLYGIGESAVKGAIGGLYLGQIGKFTHMLNPAAQAVSMGVAMTMAEALTDAAEGIDVLDEDYMKNRLPKTFLQGAAIGLWSSRGWKGRRNAMQAFATENEMAEMKEKGIIKKIPENLIDAKSNINPEAIPDVMKELKEAGIKSPDIFGEVPKSVEGAAASYLAEWGMDINQQGRRGPGKLTKVGKVKPEEPHKLKFGAEPEEVKPKPLTQTEISESLKPLVKFIAETISPVGKSDYMNITERKLEQAEGYEKVISKPGQYLSEGEILKGSRKGAGKLPEDMAKQIVKDLAGKDSIKDVTPEDVEMVTNDIQDMTVKNLKPFKNRYREAGVLEERFKPVDQLMTDTNLRDFIIEPEGAKILKGMVEQKAIGVIGSIQSQYRRFIQEDMPGRMPARKEAFGRWAKNKPSVADEVFADIIEGNIPQSQLSPRLNRLAGIYKTVTDYYWNRTNQVRLLSGEEALTYKEFYMMHQLDRPEMIRQGYKRSEIPTVESLMTTRGRGLKVSSNIKSVTEIERTQNEYPMRRDPAFALQSMIHNDLKVIYMTEPIRIMNNRVKKAIDLGLLDKSALDPNSTLNTYMEQVIMARPAPMAKQFDKMVDRMAETTPGKFVDQIASHFGRDLFTNASGQINDIVGKMTTRAFIGFKPKMAGRNVLQFLFGYGPTNAKSIGKALLPIEHPKILTDLMNESLGRKQTMEYSGEEYIHLSKGFMGKVDAMANDLFAKSAVKTFDINLLATGYNTLDRIRDPKRNWGDAEGHKLRKESGNMNLVSAREREILKKEMEEVASSVNFLYTTTGMPMIYRNAVAAPFVKLQSFTMNYFYKYLGNLNSRMWTKKPGWAKDMGVDAPSLTIGERAGFVKHFIGLGMLVAAVEKATGLDYSSLLGASFKPDEEKLRDKINFGIFDVRPNPSMSVFLGMKKMLFADEEWQREEGKRELNNALPVPYRQAYKDWEKALGQGKVAEMFVYKPYQRPVKATPKRSNNAFGKPFSGAFGKPFGGGF